MKKLTLAILFCLSILPVFGQKIINQSSEAAATVSIPNAPTISDNEWKILTDALTAENWDTSSFYAGNLLNRLKIDNERRQIAQLRYFYLFSLAGRIHKARDAGKKTNEEEAWKELDKAVNALIGKEFLLPPREYRNSCEKVLNFVCPVQNNEKAFRTAATNKDGTAIHSFDYVVFEKNVDLKMYLDKQVFLGGTLKKVEFNEELSEKQPWVMYLIFEKGFVRVVVNE
jgi:hypothetical protein